MSELARYEPDEPDDERSLAPTDDELLADAVCQVLAGVLTPANIARELGMPQEATRIRSLLNSAQGARMVFKARRDVAGTMAERMKRLLPKAVEEAAKVALDPEVTPQKTAMLKYIMDSNGLGGTQKIAINSPEAYKRALMEFAEDPDEPEGGAA